MRTALCLVIVTALAGCAATGGSGSTHSEDDTLTYHDVINNSPLASLGRRADLSSVEMLAINAEMRAFIDEHVNRNDRQSDRLGQLLQAVLGGDRFVLAYDDSTRTAIDTFENRRGNCLSFTNLFIAMARELELDAQYQEVDIPPDWSMSGQTFMISEHINVLVEIRNALSRVVDFNTYDTIIDVEAESVVISDARARAHYFNNIGVERMLSSDVGLAYANLQQSLREDESFASAWVNMGILHRREGYVELSELAYTQALKHDRSNLMAMSNLADLYEDQGRDADAQFYLSKVREHRMGNPFYRFRLANTSFNDGDYKSAIKNLKYAIRQKDDEDQFYYLLSLSYLMAGDKAQAQRWMEEAEEVAEETKDRKRYNRKLELLMGKTRNEETERTEEL